VSGPHGPVLPAGPHQFSSLSKNAILSFGIPSLSQISADSLSLGAFGFGITGLLLFIGSLDFISLKACYCEVFFRNFKGFCYEFKSVLDCFFFPIVSK